MGQILLSIFLLISLSHHVLAQKTFDWRDQGISFTLPNDFAVKTDQEFEFEAEGDQMEFGLYAFNDADLSEEDVVNYTFGLAESLELQDIDDAETIELNGFLGAYVIGYADGDLVFLLGMMNPDNDTNFYAIVTFFDDDEVAEEAALRILESIVKI